MRYFEDFVVGSRETYGSRKLDEAELTAFSSEFDPQPMHLDGASEQARRVGGLIASGWHTCALHMRMSADHFILDSAGLGSPGIRKLQWLQPVRPGDTLTGEMEVLGKKASASRPDRGFVDFRFRLINQNGEPVLDQANLIMFARREPGAPHDEGMTDITRPAPETYPDAPTASRLGHVDDIAPGTVLRYGSYAFEPETMIRFARAFDPQPFHIDETAGKASHFGGLAASGWHTSAAWMRTVILYWKEQERLAPLVKRGPGFGFEDLQWKKPVLAGDTLTYFSRVLEARKSASKPGWGIVTQRNYALNQRGEAVFAFTGAVLWEARP